MRDIEQEIVPVCELKGLGIVAWSPLAGGFLTGKYAPGQRQQNDTRSSEGWAYPQAFFAPNADETLTELIKVSQELGRSPAQVALRWVLEQPMVSSVIIGARTQEQAQDNMGATDWQMPPEALKRLNTVSFLPHRYPRSLESAMVARRANAVG